MTQETDQGPRLDSPGVTPAPAGQPIQTWPPAGPMDGDQPITLHSDWTPKGRQVSAKAMAAWLAGIVARHQPTDQLPDALVTINDMGLSVRWSTLGHD